ncbi:MAG: hypothetical protein IJS26_04700 [Alphaproteobacteria bacterium]|nr:hypothetical protein [Alphaproteobacteria bacterium]
MTNQFDGKKESILSDDNELNSFYFQGIQQAVFILKHHYPLVLDINSHNNKYPIWDSLSYIDKLILLGAYLNGNNTYKSFTVVLSYRFRQLMKETDNWADYVRRRLNVNFKNTLGFVPDYMFVIEKSKKDLEHLHGIIEINSVPETTIRDVFKRTVFGIGYKQSDINRHIFKTDNLYNAPKWIRYCLKTGHITKGKIYMTSNLKNSVKALFVQNRIKYNGFS